MDFFAPRWSVIVGSVRREFAALPAAERQWLEPRLSAVAQLPEELHSLFLGARGAPHCRDCHGLCCDCGRNHLTLVNLLGLPLDGATHPEPDFTRPCPLLSPTGCLLPAGRRPFNCVTCFCETVESELSVAAP